MAIELNNENFEELVLKSDKPAMVDMWAEWCGPCRMVGPIVEEISTEFEGKAVIGKVDVDENSELSITYGVRNIPTILFIKDGEVKDKVIGVVPKAELIKKLEALM